jgi:flagellar hook-associated protein 1 FlgK|tara:strand:- start:33321 stop:34691 length:1371 start_codon:yes stop_codon:yes gene_type:complete
MPNISGLYTALSGMNAQRRVLDVTAHNVANQATEGYHRQRVDLRAVGVSDVATVFAGRDIRVGGVDATAVTRMIDNLAEDRALRQTATYGGTQTMRANLDRIEMTFPEPSENGIAAQLDELWASWSDLSSDPDNPVVRSQLLDRARGVIEALGRASADLDAVSDSSARQVPSMANEVNNLADRIAKLNQAIVGSGDNANGLLDQRDLLVKELAGLTGAVSRPAANGAVDVTINGRAIVSGPRAEPVNGSTGTFIWVTDGATVSAPPSRMAALAKTINDVVPRYRAALDDVAATLVTQVNALHTTGYDLSGATGLNFFDPAKLTAQSISLSSDVDGQPEKVAAGAPAFPGPVAPGLFDGDLARQLATLADGAGGPGMKYQSMVAALGSEARTATQRDVVQSEMTLAANIRADSVGGVSIDEEMANLMSAQRAYAASARVLTSVDEMLGVLMRTGAGR